jgi:orotate phosphoribosyltransferase
VVVIEDLVSTGKSSLQAVDALLDKGLNVIGMVSIFTYGFPVAQQEFDKKSIKYYSLTDYSSLLSMALEQGTLTGQELALLESWRNDPAGWMR